MALTNPVVEILTAHFALQRAQSSISNFLAGDNVTGGLNAGVAAAHTGLYGLQRVPAVKAQLDEALSRAAESSEHGLRTPTAVIDCALFACNIIDTFNGFGPPDQGGEFNTAEDKFALADVQLQLAEPDEREWDGPAADAYAAFNAKLTVQVRSMASLHAEMQALMKTQAASVKAAHDACARTIATLWIAQVTALFLYLWSPLASFRFQLACAISALTYVLDAEAATAADSSEVTSKVEQLASRFSEVLAEAERMLSGLPRQVTPRTEAPLARGLADKNGRHACSGAGQ